MSIPRKRTRYVVLARAPRRVGNGSQQRLVPDLTVLPDGTDHADAKTLAASPHVLHVWEVESNTRGETAAIVVEWLARRASGRNASAMTVCEVRP